MIVLHLENPPIDFPESVIVDENRLIKFKYNKIVRLRKLCYIENPFFEAQP
jgi:hypothetical protein